MNTVVTHQTIKQGARVLKAALKPEADYLSKQEASQVSAFATDLRTAVQGNGQFSMDSALFVVHAVGRLLANAERGQGE